MSIPHCNCNECADEVDRREMLIGQLEAAVEELLGSLDELLVNLADAGATHDEETEEMYPDISRAYAAIDKAKGG